MIYSMTGFGRAEIQTDELKIAVELKSVNHRYLEFSIKAPKKFSLFEANIRSVLKEYAQRGKLDVFITYSDFTKTRVSLNYNEELARQYLGYAASASEAFGIANDMTAVSLLRCPDVLTMEEQEIDEDELWKELEEALRKAAETFRSARNIEGEHLKADLLAKLDNLEKNVVLIQEREPAIMEEYRARLEEKTRELLSNAQIDEGRIAAEVVLFADKICTDEETVRLLSHISNMRNTLGIGLNIGRKLDFIAQEMNREANTILSKSNDLVTSNIAVDMKTEIEKIREQVQNIE